MSNDLLRIEELRAAVMLALDTFESEHGSEIRVERDHYWHLPVEASFDLEHEPQRLTVGQISDDLDEIRQFLAQGDADPTWHSLSHVIGLLRLMESYSLP